MKPPTRQHLLVLGLGRSGRAAADLALRNECDLTIVDENQSPELEDTARRFRNRGATVILGGDSWRLPTAPDLVVISPGIGPQSALHALAEQSGAPVVSELEYGYRSCSCPIIAITGTNGKTTTTELTMRALRAAGLEAAVAGNVGTPLCEAALRSAALDYLVVEVSSFQLEHVEQFAPVAAVFLNLSPDHLDRHGDMAAYCDLKLKLFDRLESPASAVVAAALLAHPAVAAHPLWQRGRPTTFALDDADADFRLTTDGQLLAPSSRPTGDPVSFLARAELRLQGDHNVANVLAAAALCRAVGVEPAAIADSLAAYAPAPHRLELVANRNGVRFVNDSKSTNPDALAAALFACAGSPPQPTVHLIAGGADKAMDFDFATDAVSACARAVYLIGASRDKLFDAWSGHVPCQKYSSLAAAVREAVDNAGSGDTVLLSPGCASFDQFRDYADRGTTFTQEIHRSLRSS